MRSTSPVASRLPEHPAEPASRTDAAADRRLLLGLLAILVVTRAVVLAGLLVAKHGDLAAAVGNGAAHTYDAAWYDLIVQHGYRDPHLGSPITLFYPGYPAVVAALYWPLRALAGLFLSGQSLQQAADGVLLPAATVLVCNAALIVAVVLLWRLYRPRLGAAATFVGIACLLVAPSAFFLSVGYSESLFLVAAVGAFLLAGRGQWAPAGLAAGLAALIRFPGAFLLVPLAILWWQAGRPRPRAAAVGTVLALAGAIAFPAWLWLQTGDPLAYLHQQATHHRFLIGPMVAVRSLLTQSWDAVKAMAGRPSGAVRLADVPTVLANLLAFVVALATLALGGRRVGAAGLSWVAIVFILPLLSGTSESLDRYWLAAFPAFMLIGWWLRRSSATAVAAMAASTAWMAVLVYNFGRVVWAG